MSMNLTHACTDDFVCISKNLAMSTDIYRFLLNVKIEDDVNAIFWRHDFKLNDTRDNDTQYNSLNCHSAEYFPLF
jgi:hypothetical protein